MVRSLLFRGFFEKIAISSCWRCREPRHHGSSADNVSKTTAPDAELGCQSVRQHRQSFNWFLAGTFASAIGRNGYHIACAWILVAEGFGSAAVAVFFAIISVTELVASPVAGWMSDRWDRRLLYVIADCLRFVAILTLGAILIEADLRWAIWLSAAIFATCDRIALTASQSMIPGIAAHLSLSTGNSIVFFLMQAGSLVAAAFIGVILHFSTPTYTFTVLSMAFALSVGCMLAVRQERAFQQAGALGPGPKLVIDANLLQLGAIYALLYTGGVLVSVIGPSFVFDELAGTAIEFGQLESAWSAGSIIGALLLIPLVRAARISALQIVILGMTASSFAILKVLDLPWSLLIFAVLGILYNLGRVAVEVMLQSWVPVASLGRAKGALHSTGVLLGVVLFGFVAVAGDEMQPSSIFFAYSVVLAAGTLALTIWRVPATRDSAR